MLEELRKAGKVYQLTGCAEDWITTRLKGFWGLRTDQTYQWMGINAGDYCLFYATGPEWAEAPGSGPPEGIIGMGKVARKSDKTSLEWISEIQSHVSSRPLLIHFSEMWWLGDVDNIADESIREKLARGDEYIAGDVRTLTGNAITVEELATEGVSYAPAKAIAELKTDDEALLEVLVSRLSSSRYGIDWNERDSFFAVWAYDMLDQDSLADRAGLFRQVADITGQTPEAVERKVQNVSFHDPRARDEKPSAEAANAQTLLKQVFDWYWKDRCSARACFGRLYQAAVFGLDMHVIHGEGEKEGQQQMLVEEALPGRDAVVQRQAAMALLDQVMEHFREQDGDGKLRCSVCGFAAPEGCRGKIVQLHHQELIWATDENGDSISQEEMVSKLIPLCPTCHALAHTESPPLLADGIKALRDAGQSKISV